MARRRFKVDKLVRDYVPDIMISHNIDIESRTMEVVEFLKRLKDKLVEESKEVVNAKTPQDLLEELSDVWEVYKTLLNKVGFSMEQIEEKCLVKKEEKGSFKGRIYCEYIEMDSNNPKIDYYKEKPEEYPEVEIK